MARPTNEDRRDEVRATRMELMLEYPLAPACEINQKVAEKLAIPIHSVWYYLRIDKHTDGRTRYATAEIQKLVNMSRQELKMYAAANNKNFNTLYAVVWRYKAKTPTSSAALNTYAEIATNRGYLDFLRKADLKAFNLPGDAIKTTRKAFRESVPDLDIIGPNYLIHKVHKRYYPMSLSEQRFLLTNPKRFLKENAAHISKSWWSYDAAGNHYFVLVDISRRNEVYEGVALSIHASLERASEAARDAIRGHVVPKPTPTKIIRCFGAIKESLCIRYSAGDLVPKRAPDIAEVIVPEDWERPPHIADDIFTPTPEEFTVSVNTCSRAEADAIRNTPAPNGQGFGFIEMTPAVIAPVVEPIQTEEELDAAFDEALRNLEDNIFAPSKAPNEASTAPVVADAIGCDEEGYGAEDEYDEDGNLLPSN